MTIRTRLTDRSWWGAALLRGLYTAIAVALPYLGAATLVEVPWLTVASTAALAFIVSLVTSLAGLPEVEGVDLPWWVFAILAMALACALGILGIEVNVKTLGVMLTIETGLLLIFDLVALVKNGLDVLPGSSFSPSEIVVTARHWCGCEHGTLTDPDTVGPSAQTIQASFGSPRSSPFAVVGRSTYSLLCSPPPTTSQRYHRAPSSQAASEGRNHAQLTTVRITRLSSAPRKSMNACEQVEYAHAPSSRSS